MIALKTHLKQHISTEQVESTIKAFLSSTDPFTKEMLNHAKAVQGKRLRAQVTLLSAKLFGRVTKKADMLATSLELFHHATLIHDDIIDHAKVRRNRPSMNHMFGNETAVMVGDYLFTQVMQIVVKTMSPQVQQIIAQAASNVCLGEIQEIGARNVDVLEEETYFDIISNKTASLFAAACQGGAILNGATKGEAKSLAEIGQYMGLAFQIQDDILDLTGESKALGKLSGIDLKEGRQTLPVILGLKLTTPKKRKQLKSILANPDKHQKNIVAMLEECGALDQARAKALYFADKAIKKLERFKDSLARRVLIELIYFSVERKA